NLRGHLGGVPPRVDLAAEKLLGDLLINASRDGMIDAAHDLSEGGLAGALAEMVLRFGVGARVNLAEIAERDGVDAFTALFSESQARALVAVPRTEEVRFKDMTTARRFPVARIGVVDVASGALEVQDQFTLPIEELRAAWAGTLPTHSGCRADLLSIHRRSYFPHGDSGVKSPNGCDFLFSPLRAPQRLSSRCGPRWPARP
ncbi:MAG: AIR synthase-related protein, partial [Citricoccus sp.]